jgi:DNA polymerase delta subunit 1
MEIIRSCARIPSTFGGVGKVQLQILSFKDAGKEILMFGTSPSGESVTIRINGFEPFFYVKPKDGVPSYVCEQSIIKWFRSNCEDCVPVIEHVQRSIIQNLQTCSEQMNVLKVHFPSSKLRRLLSQAIRNNELAGIADRGIFEDTVNPLNQFVAVTNNVPCWFVEVESLDLIPESKRISKTQIEIVCELKHCVPKPEILVSAPFTILAIDIEVATKPNTFPVPKEDPVICISCVVRGPFCDRTLLLCWRLACPPAGKEWGFEQCLFSGERQMLIAFTELVRVTDPDIITGYNVMDFDLNYLLRRAETLGVREMTMIGRIKKTKVWQREDVFSSKQKGMRVTKMADVDGRVIFDLLPVMQGEYQLESYSLGFVTTQLLKRTKEDVPHYLITGLWNGTDEDRYRVYSYCVKDSLLCNDATKNSLIVKEQLLISFVEMAKVCRTPIHSLVFKGQQERVMSLLMPWLQEAKLILPFSDKSDKKKESDITYNGGLVLEPVKGFHEKEIVATLDFNSLYPSIIQRFNLCYTTLIPKGQEHLWPVDSYDKAPNGCSFLKSETKKGILPRMLETLLLNRKLAKKAMEEAPNETLRDIQNRKQLALKKVANSAYGFTGATVGKLPCIEIASAVTSYGQTLLMAAKGIAESKGYRVLYGDTDSIFVVMGLEGEITMEQGFKTANLLCSDINSTFKAPLKMEVEKLLTRCIFVKKKMYICVMWMCPEKPKDILLKGVAAVRRDRAPILRKTIKTFMDLLLMKKDKAGAFQFLDKTVSDLYDGNVHIINLISSMSLSKPLEAYDGKHAQVEAARRAKQRDPGYEAGPGSRIPFVYIDGVYSSSKTALAEDPLFVIETGKQIMYDQYVENLESALSSILKFVYGQKKTRQVFGKKVGHSPSKLTCGLTVSPFLEGLGVKPTCIHCRKPVISGMMCDACLSGKPGTAERKKREEKLVLDIEECDKAWAKCVECQGNDMVAAKLCKARDCPNYYVRAVADQNKKRSEEAMKSIKL